MAKVKNQYSFDLSDHNSAELAIRNLKKYLFALDKERAKWYAERMAFEGEKYANQILAQEGNAVEYVMKVPNTGGRAKITRKEQGRRIREGIHGTRLPLDIEADAEGYSRTFKGRTSAFVVLKGSDATFAEFGTGVAMNKEEHPYKAESGLDPIGGYGRGFGSNPNGWVFLRDGTKYHTRGIKQTRVLYRTAQHLKALSPSIAKTAFRMKNP